MYDLTGGRKQAPRMGDDRRPAPLGRTVGLGGRFLSRPEKREYKLA